MRTPDAAPAKKKAPKKSGNGGNLNPVLDKFAAKNTANVAKNGAWGGLGATVGTILSGAGSVSGNPLLKGIGDFFVGAEGPRSGVNQVQATPGYDPSKSFYGGGDIGLDALNAMAHKSQAHAQAHPTAASAPSLSDQLLQQIMAESQGGLQSSSGTFSGKLSDYISQAEGMIPKVSYDPAVKAVKQNAALGDTRITDGYHALASYFAGLQPQIQQQTADYGSNIKGADNAAAALLNAAYASSAKDAATSAQTGTANEGVGLQAAQAISNQQHQATSGSLAQGLQNALTMSNNQGSIQQDLARQQGGAAQLQGMEAKDAIQKALVNQLAQYATLQSQANQQGALQALQMGEGQFNSDRSYYEQEAARADTTSNNAWNRLIQEYQLVAGADPNSAMNKAASAKSQAAQAAAQALQDEKSGVSLSGQRTSFINAYLAKFGTLPTAAQIKAAGF